MPDQPKKHRNHELSRTQQPAVVDAIHQVGPILEAGRIFLLPANSQKITSRTNR